MSLTSLEICSGAGGQALGIERAGFEHLALVEIDGWACKTLKQNRPNWNVLQQDIREFSGTRYRGIDLLAGGVPCPPFSIAGKQLGHLDDRNLFPEALRLVQETRPRAVMFENVRGLLSPAFASYREQIDGELREWGYEPEWSLLNASEFGVPQLRPRAILVALRDADQAWFRWPAGDGVSVRRVSVGEALYDVMASRGWPGVDQWAKGANDIAPTIVGGSRKHGGPDLGPTRARKAWAALGVNGASLADEPPGPDFEGMPRLTVGMAAIIQGFPRDWEFAGKKTPAYRQVGNAFPPPVAEAVARAIKAAILRDESVEPLPRSRQLTLLQEVD